jgi:hypothetical protein
MEQSQELSLLVVLLRSALHMAHESSRNPRLERHESVVEAQVGVALSLPLSERTSRVIEGLHNDLATGCHHAHI